MSREKRRQETGDRSQGSGFGVQVSGGRGQGAGDRSQETGVRSENGGRKPGRWTLLLAVVLVAGCALPRAQFSDADWVSHVTTGRGCHERGDFRRGADAFGRAQERARALDDAEALAVSAVNRAVCLQQMGRPEEALAGVEEALADARVSSARQMELQVVGARSDLALGRLDNARMRTAVVLKSKPSPVLRAQALLVQGGADLAQMDAAAAEQTLAKLPPTAWGQLPPSLRAERAELEAQTAAMLESPDGAWKWQEEAVRLWQDAGRLPEMARALAAAGRQARAAGDPTAASDRFWRAARSLWAQGLHDEAAQVLEEGVVCAAAFKDEAAGQRLAELVVTFKNGKRLSE